MKQHNIVLNPAISDDELERFFSLIEEKIQVDGWPFVHWRFYEILTIEEL